MLNSLACERTDQLGLPVASSTADPDDLAAPHGQIDRTEACTAKIRGIQDVHLVDGRYFLARVGRYVAACHVVHQLLRRGRLGAHYLNKLSVAEHLDLRRDRENLVKAMRHKDHARPARSEKSHAVEEDSHTALVESGGRFVEEDDIGISRQHAGGLDQALRALGHITDQVGKGDVANAEVVEQVATPVGLRGD